MTLIDTGPLVALHDARDSYYTACVAVRSHLQVQSYSTTWACFAEAMHLLGNAGGFRLQAQLWQARNCGLLELIDLSPAEITLCGELMDRYRDNPMDLADATLAAVADFRSWRKVFTLDTHFFSYRLRDGRALDVILPTRD